MGSAESSETHRTGAGEHPGRVFRLWCISLYRFTPAKLSVKALRHVLALIDVFLKAVRNA